MKLRRLFSLLLLALPLAASAQTAPSQQPRLANAIAVIVNDAVITLADVDRHIAPFVEILYRQYGDRPELFEQKRAEARQSGTEDLVVRQLILHDFRTAGYNLPESLIEDEIKDRIRDRFGDRRTLTQTLNSQGITYEAYRQQVRDDFIVSALRSQRVSGNIIISPAKIENYYAAHRDEYQQAGQVKLRMIVVKENVAVPGAARKLLEEVRGKVQTGAAFAEMAALYSEGSQKSQGGDWGWIDRNVLQEKLTEVAFKLKAGEMSEVVELPGAAYLLNVEAVKVAQTKALSEVRTEVEQKLIEDERARQQKQYIERLRAKSLVRYF
ncbi:MAG: peptidyl-prolyl cis-trans isomerase [Verrucomicrobia bacterium]|nr:peptidyl-prolyl cis-trans isomerase [Verrucomicrobiota bacterium]